MEPRWTIERTDEVKALWASGLSAAQVAEEMGGVSRNAVLGKLHRLKVRERPKTLKPPRPKLKRRSPRKMAPRPLDLLLAEPLLMELSPDAMTIEGLTPETCRWPLSDPRHDMLYCGSQRHAPFVYCTRHAQIAYRPIFKRK